ncbi:hypothetical protein V6Z11_A01G250200 [Gossypium hirsutum]
MDVSEPTKTYMCENVKCSERLVGLLSNYKTTKCSCGKLMSRDGSGREMDVVKDETKGESMFFITDGLVVMKGLPEEVLEIDSYEMSNLLSYSLVSRTTLTDAFLRKQRILSGEKSLLVAPNMEETVENDVKTSVKIILRKSDWKISFAETNEDFVGLLFSFLTIPFDSVLELLLGSNLTIGSISYLLQDLNIMLSITEPKYSKKAVLQPFYSCPKEFPSICSEVRFSSFLDPKSPNPNSRYSSGYVLKNSSFLVTDDLVVKSVSSVSIISVLKELNIPLVDVEQLVISIGQFEALALLKACLCSSSPLSALKNYIVKKRKRKPLQ